MEVKIFCVQKKEPTFALFVYIVCSFFKVVCSFFNSLVSFCRLKKKKKKIMHVSCHVSFNNTRIKTFSVVNVKTIYAKVFQSKKEERR